MVKEVVENLAVSERKACKVLDQPKDQLERRKPAENEFQGRLRKRIAELACEYGRYGYRRITALLQAEGWKVNNKRARKDMAAGRIKGSKEAATEKETLV